MFPFGRALLVLAIIAVVCGVAVAARSPLPRPDLLLWLPSATHHKQFAPLLADWRPTTGGSVGLELIAGRPLNIRLLSMFMGDRRDRGVPDLVTIEIGQVGKYFRPPPDGIGLRPLDPWLDRLLPDGRTWRQRILPSRLAPWSRSGVCFGIPFDLHPVGLAWREDLWLQAGIDLTVVTTWEEFHAAGLRYQAYWRDRGEAHRWAFEVQETSGDFLGTLLLQRGVNLIDGPRIHLSDPVVAEALAWWTRVVSGPEAIGWASPGSTALLAGDVADGKCGALLCPDWRAKIFKDNAGDRLAGKLRVRALPVFAVGDAPTSTWGGTMIGITRACPDPDAAWQVIERLFLSPESLSTRRRESAQIPPLPEYWSDPGLAEPDPWFRGPPPLRLFADLAPQVPRRVVTAETGLAMAALGNVLATAVAHVRRGGGYTGLEQIIATALTAESADLKRRIAHASFATAAVDNGTAAADQAGVTP